MNVLEKDKKIISIQLEKYIKIIIEEYKDNIPDFVINYLNGKNILDLIKIEDTNTISLFVCDGKIYLPINAYKIINVMKRIPGYGINKKHITHNQENMIINNNTFLDYIKHVFVKGLTPLEYFLEILLHETMHLCGSDGRMGLKEGFTELKTREIAKKYNLNTSCCGYSKETKIAYELQSILGKDICNRITFINDENIIYELIKKEVGEKEAKLYQEVLYAVEKEFITYMNKDFPGITGPIKKTYEYSKLDYSKVRDIFLNYYGNLEISDINNKR